MTTKCSQRQEGMSGTVMHLVLDAHMWRPYRRME